MEFTLFLKHYLKMRYNGFAFKTKFCVPNNSGIRV